MNDSTLLPHLATANDQMGEIQTAILARDYGALQGLLLQQAVVLHKIGMDFIEKSCSHEPIRHKRACIDVGLRAFNMARKTMASIKYLEG